MPTTHWSVFKRPSNRTMSALVARSPCPVGGWQRRVLRLGHGPNPAASMSRAALSVSKVVPFTARIMRYCYACHRTVERAIFPRQSYPRTTQAPLRPHWWRRIRRLTPRCAQRWTARPASQGFRDSRRCSTRATSRSPRSTRRSPRGAGAALVLPPGGSIREPAIRESHRPGIPRQGVPAQSPSYRASAAASLACTSARRLAGLVTSMSSPYLKMSSK